SEASPVMPRMLARRRAALVVISQQIVPGDESADRWLTIKGAVPTMPIVVVQPTGQGHRAAGRGGIGRAVGPFAQQGANEAFRLAVGAWGVGPGPAMLEPTHSAGGGE